MPGSEKKRSQNALSPTSRNSISDRPASLKPWTRRWTKIPGKKPNDSERFRVVDRKLPLNGVTVLGPEAVDYLKILVGSQAVAVASRIRRFLGPAGLLISAGGQGKYFESYSRSRAERAV